MATSSITKNFVISGQKQVEMFVDAIESSGNNRPVRIPVAAYDLRDWAPEHEKMGKGITLSADEVQELYKILKNIVED